MRLRSTKSGRGNAKKRKERATDMAVNDSGQERACIDKSAVFAEYRKKGKTELLTLDVICFPLFVFLNALFLLFPPTPSFFWIAVYVVAVILLALPLPVTLLFWYDCKHFDPERLTFRTEYLRVVRHVSRHRFGTFGKHAEVDLYFETFRISLPEENPLTNSLAVGKNYHGVFLETSLSFLAPLTPLARNPIRVFDAAEYDLPERK